MAIEMPARNANARLLEIPNCGHMPPLLDAEQIRIVSDWINARSVGLAAVNPPGKAASTATTPESKACWPRDRRQSNEWREYQRTVDPGRGKVTTLTPSKTSAQARPIRATQTEKANS